MNQKEMMKKKIYKWHRITSLIVAIPVFLWALSGFMHPIMTNVRPAVHAQDIPMEPLDVGHVQIPLEEVLKEHEIDSLYGVRLVHIDTNWFYQLKVNPGAELIYASAKNGNLLVRGDWLYAQYLARTFLEGPVRAEKTQAAGNMPAHHMSASMMDCCGEAAATVLNHERGASVSGASIVRAFNEEYKSIYCLLPVYKVTFKRSDGIRLYVETGQDRFAVAVDNKRAAFTDFFNLVHSWTWLDRLGKGRTLAILFFSGLAFVSALMGLYVFFNSKGKRSAKNALVRARWRHRVTAIVAVLFTLMFTFSGFYHALEGWGGEEKKVLAAKETFAAKDLHLDLTRLQALVGHPIGNIGLARVQGAMYWQVYVLSDSPSEGKDLMKDLGVEASSVIYVKASDYSLLPKGDERYARELAARWRSPDGEEPISAELVTHFTEEYNFTDKRLPVWKISYPDRHRERLYVETSTAVLAKQTNDLELYEGYSFALLHKHHFWDFIGKTFRDASTMLGAFLQVVLVLLGCLLWMKKRKRTLAGNTK